MKLAMLFLFISSNLLLIIVNKKRIISYSLINYFYLLTSLAGALWSLIGLSNGGDIRGVVDSVRLYIIWSAAYFIIITLLRNNIDFKVIHVSIIMSGMAISLINFLGLSDFYFGWSLFSYQLLKDLEMFIGIHDNYVQITSHNIGPLFFIVPYMIAVRFQKNGVLYYPLLTKISLFLCIILVAASGRRALWLAIVFVPVLIYVSSILTKNLSNLIGKLHALVLLYTIVFFFFLTVFSLDLNTTVNIGVLDYLESAFSKEDERTIQLGFLMESFYNAPFWGSGFGVDAGYIRNDERPWIYELTYFQMLFNFGIIGTTFWFTVVMVYCCKVLAVTRSFGHHRNILLAILAGILSFFIGMYSNPYLGSFDFLVYLGFLPLVASLTIPKKPFFNMGSQKFNG